MSKKFQPYPALRLSGMFIKECIVAAPTFEGALVVYQRPAMPGLPGGLGVGVNTLVWHDKNLPDGPHPDLVRDGNNTLQVALSRIKKAMLTHGACAESVRLIGELSPFTKEELKIMAEKLKGKGAPAAKEPKTKPVAGGGKVADKPKGNPEALKKAQEATASKRAAAREQKIKVLNKKHTAREGTFRANMLEDLFKSKTVGEFYDMNDKYDAGCLRFAKEAGFVSVG